MAKSDATLHLKNNKNDSTVQNFNTLKTQRLLVQLVLGKLLEHDLRNDRTYLTTSNFMIEIFENSAN